MFEKYSKRRSDSYFRSQGGGIAYSSMYMLNLGNRCFKEFSLFRREKACNGFTLGHLFVLVTFKEIIEKGAIFIRRTDPLF